MTPRPVLVNHEGAKDTKDGDLAAGSDSASEWPGGFSGVTVLIIVIFVSSRLAVGAYGA